MHLAVRFSVLFRYDSMRCLIHVVVGRILVFFPSLCCVGLFGSVAVRGGNIRNRKKLEIN